VKLTTYRVVWSALAALCVLLAAGCPQPTTEPPTSSGPAGVEAPPAPPAGETAAEPPENIGNAKNAEGKYVCPVLGQPVSDFSSEGAAEYEGKAYFFCCPGCKPKFDEDPAKYAKAAAAGEIPEGTAPADEHAGHDHG